MQILRCARKYLDPDWVDSQAKRIAGILGQTRFVESVFWFGSGAEGKMTDLSDFDFLVVASSVQEIRKARENLKQLRPLSEFPVDIVWVTSERFHKMKGVGGVCLIAFEDGKCLYRREKISND